MCFLIASHICLVLLAGLVHSDDGTRVVVESVKPVLVVSMEEQVLIDVADRVILFLVLCYVNLFGDIGIAVFLGRATREFGEQWSNSKMGSARYLLMLRGYGGRSLFALCFAELAT